MFYRNTSKICNEVLHTNVKELLDNSPRNKKLKSQNNKLKSKIKSLRETIRQLRKGRKKKSKKDETSEFEVLRELGKMLLPQKFARVLSVQIDAQMKSDRGMRYSSDLKKYALSLYYLSPHNYKELKKKRFNCPLFVLYNYLRRRGILYRE